MTEDAILQMVQMAATTAVGTLVGWLMCGVRSKAERLRETSEREERERLRNREIMGDLLFYRLTDLHHRYVVLGEKCSAADKQQVEDVYRHYHDELGLNGPGTHMYEEILDAHQG